MSDTNTEQLEFVDEWDSHGNPYWNGVARSGGHAPGTGKLHRARIENGRVVEVECHANADSWVPFTARSAPQEDRRTCSRCGSLTKVPGVEPGEFWSRVQLTEDYAPAEWAPKPATDGGESAPTTSATTLRCLLFAHDWSIEPPWTGKELRYRPHCERCGHEPDDIQITGSARDEIEHRVAAGGRCE